MKLLRLNRSAVAATDLRLLGGTHYVHYLITDSGEGLVVTDWRTGGIVAFAAMEGSWEGVRVLATDPRTRSFVTDRGARMTPAGWAAIWRPAADGALLTSGSRVDVHPGDGSSSERHATVAALDGEYVAVLRRDGSGEIYRHADGGDGDQPRLVSTLQLPGPVEGAGFVGADGRFIVVCDIEDDAGRPSTSVLLFRPGADVPIARRDIADGSPTVAISREAGVAALDFMNALNIVSLEPDDQLTPVRLLTEGDDEWGGSEGLLGFVAADMGTVLVRAAWTSDPGSLLEFRQLDGAVVGTLQTEEPVTQFLDVGEDGRFAVRCGETVDEYEILPADAEDAGTLPDHEPTPSTVVDWSASVEPWDLTAAETLELLCQQDPRPSADDTTTTFSIYGEELMIPAMVIRELVIWRVLVKRLMPGYQIQSRPPFFVIEEGKPLVVPVLARGENFESTLPPPLDVARTLWSYGDGRQGLKLGVYRADEFARKLRSQELFRAVRQRLYERGYLYDRRYKRLVFRLVEVKVSDAGREIRDRLRASTVDADEFARWVDHDPDRARRYLRSAAAAGLTFLDLEPHIRRLAGKVPGLVRQRPTGGVRPQGIGHIMSTAMGAAERSGEIDLGPAQALHAPDSHLDLASTSLEDISAAADMWTDLGNMGFHGGGHDGGHDGGHHAGHDGGSDGGGIF